MYTNIVVAIDGSELADKAFQHAIVLAKEAGGQLTVVTSTEPTVLGASGMEVLAVNAGELMVELEEAKTKSATETLDKAEAEAKQAGVTIKKIHVPSAIPADAILGTADTVAANLIVMGSHGRRGLGRLLLGSQAAEVLARSRVPVLVVK